MECDLVSEDASFVAESTVDSASQWAAPANDDCTGDLLTRRDSSCIVGPAGRILATGLLVLHLVTNPQDGSTRSAVEIRDESGSESVPVLIVRV